MAKDYYEDNLKDSDWLGEVVDIEDPKMIGRVRVKVFGKFDDLETNMIPWARPANNVTSASKSGGGFYSSPKLGSIVNVNFDNGNLYAPEYTFIQKISDELKKEIADDNYPNAQSLLYDTEIEGGLKIFYTKERGLMIKLSTCMVNLATDKTITITNKAGDTYEADGNSIVIDPDGNLKVDMDKDMIVNIAGNTEVNIEGDTEVNIKGNTEVNIDGDTDVNIKGDTKVVCDKDVSVKAKNVVIDHSSSVELGKGAIEHLVLGETFMNTVFNTHVHIGNIGIPTSPPVVPMTSAALSKKEVKTL